MAPIDPRDPASGRTPSRGRCYLYVAPCVHEDLLKLGYSRDPLERFQSLHRRWYELFDPCGIALVETDTVRDARDLELALKRELLEHNATAPLTVERVAGGHGEWYRGAADRLHRAVQHLRQQGHRVHAPAREWLRQSLLARAELLFAWTQAALSPDELEGRSGHTAAQGVVRDALDAFPALGLDLEPWLPPDVLQWYRRGGGVR